MTTTEDATRALEDSAVALLQRRQPFWWIGCNFLTPGTRYYAELWEHDGDPWEGPLERVEFVDYDDAVAECVRRNRAAVEAGA